MAFCSSAGYDGIAPLEALANLKRTQSKASRGTFDADQALLARLTEQDRALLAG